MATPAFKLTVDSKSLTLIEFDGFEAMNRLFEYTFTCEKPSSLSLLDVINADAIYTICSFDDSIYEDDIEMEGYISSASIVNDNWVLNFHPKLKKASSNNRSEIYFKQDSSLSAKDIIAEEMATDVSLEGREIYNCISEALPTRKLFCQYQESDFNFVARLCDHWGFHFYFDHFLNRIVFADDSGYLQEITTTFKTKRKTVDNDALKIMKWSESRAAATSYITTVGHDHANAASSIKASFPLDDQQAGLTEATHMVCDVSSQEEAEYLARIKYEANNCHNHKASGTSGIPYFIPGFLVSMQDKDFSSALVTQTTHKARNLNAVNSAELASYECDFELIPGSVCFRPQPHYPIPQATSVLGTTHSDATDSTLAQRNDSGEYKVKLMGFENESGVSGDPWVRKAQTSAGSNSVDIPLTPNTEVLLSFIDNNPNCPYIQHALDNSLHPVPVTNVNPHHAVISTDGMLVTSSLQGRYNLATTRHHERADDTEISSSIKNYFIGRGDFDQNKKFIDPSDSTAPDFTPDDRASGNYITKQFYGDQIHISQGDRLHWHAGNMYDFKGYWNYNLGNTYKENYLNRSSQINQIASPFIDNGYDVTVADILKKGGPDFEEVVWPVVSGKIDLANGDHPFPKLAGTSAPFYKDNVNVSKTFLSNSYKFNSLCNEVSVLDRTKSLTINHLNAESNDVDVMFKNGLLRSFEKNEHRHSIDKKWGPEGKLQTEVETTKTPSSGAFNKVETKEKNYGINGKGIISDTTTTKKDSSVTTDKKTYNMDTQALASHNIKTTDGMGTAEMNFAFAAAATSKFNFGASTAFSLSAQADTAIAISLSGSAKINVGFGAAVTVKTGVEAGLTMDLRTGIEAKIVGKGKMKVSGIGFNASVESRPSAKQKTIELAQIISTISDYGCKIDQSKAKISSGGLDITSSFTTIFL